VMYVKRCQNDQRKKERKEREKRKERKKRQKEIVDEYTVSTKEFTKIERDKNETKEKDREQKKKHTTASQNLMSLTNISNHQCCCCCCCRRGSQINEYLYNAVPVNTCKLHRCVFIVGSSTNAYGFC
jgi:hypothetical protein